MEIVSRANWGARRPRSIKTVSWAQRTEFVVHHSEGPTTQSVRSIQDFHMDTRGWSDIGYNFLVRDDGTIYEGRGWLVAGAHATNHNTSGVGVCYIGQNNPSEKARDTIRELYDEACRRAGRALTKRGHGQLSGNSTDCPGSVLLAWVKSGMPATAGKADKLTAPSGNPALRMGDSGSRVVRLQTVLNFVLKSGLVIDGDFGAKTRAAVIQLQTRSRIDTDGIYGNASANALQHILES